MIEQKKRDLGLTDLTDKEIIILALKESREIERELRSEMQADNASSASKVLNKSLIDTLSKVNETLLNHIYK